MTQQTNPRLEEPWQRALRRGVLRKAAGAAFASVLLVLTVQVPQAAADEGAEFCGHHVQGAILAKYQELGGEKSPLGCPQTDELTTPDGVGRYNTFAGGSIYWSPDTDAHPVWGVIGDKWGAMGWEDGSLGYPASDELTNPDGKGKRQKFQRGTIYWHPTASNGAHAVSGKIGWVWSAYNWESGDFGYPTSDVQWDKDNKENYQQFSGNRFIFHSPNGNDIEACQRECAGYYGTAPDNPADPEVNLINQTRVEFPLDGSMGDWKDTFVVRAWPTREGRLAGRALVPREWDQMWKRAPKPWGMTDDKSESVYKQLACHAVYAAPKPGGGWLGGYSWDLESWRPNISWAKALTPLTNSKCNWED